MKTRNLYASLLTGAAFILLTLSAKIAAAQDSVTTPDGTSAPPLSPGVSQVVELSQAQVNETTIVNYVQGSGLNYDLKPNDIIYLKQQGVSDPVINAMLNQHDSSAVAQTAPVINNTYVETPTVVEQPTIVDAQPAPSTPVIIIPDTQTLRYDHWYYNHANGFRYGNGFDDWTYSSYPAVSASIGDDARWDNHFHRGSHH